MIKSTLGHIMHGMSTFFAVLTGIFGILAFVVAIIGIFFQSLSLGHIFSLMVIICLSCFFLILICSRIEQKLLGIPVDKIDLGSIFFNDDP